MRERGGVIKRCGMRMISCEDVDVWRLGMGEGLGTGALRLSSRF